MSATAYNQRKCIEQCVHFDITDELIHQAMQDEQQMKLQKGEHNPTTVNMNPRMHFLGSLAQNGLFAKVREMGIALEQSAYFNPNAHADKADYWHRGMSNDVKGSPTGDKYIIIYPNSRLLVHDDDEAKKVDYYTFVKIDQTNRVGHIVGVAAYDDVWKQEQVFNSPNIKRPCHFVLAKNTIPFRKFLFAI